MHVSFCKLSDRKENSEERRTQQKINKSPPQKKPLDVQPKRKQILFMILLAPPPLDIYHYNNKRFIKQGNTPTHKVTSIELSILPKKQPHVSQDPTHFPFFPKTFADARGRFRVEERWRGEEGNATCTNERSESERVGTWTRERDVWGWDRWKGRVGEGGRR